MFLEVDHFSASSIQSHRLSLTRINALIKDCLRHPFEGIGKPEPLKESLSGFWSRRIDDTHPGSYTHLRTHETRE
ncbi:MAG: Txe/YoeB family addiction module toxin, partial [Rhodocyclaceae bacterium]|nr:Txe/YoeB family addiction module toxin [Rhodocyclaceae bacterium]